MQQEEAAPAKPGGAPYGLLLGVALGLGLAVAFGISFSFLAPLVRENLGTQKSDDAAKDSDSASSQEHDEK